MFLDLVTLDSFFGEDNSFRVYSIAHLLPLLFFVLMGWIWINRSKTWTMERRTKSAFVFSIFLMSLVIFHILVKVFLGSFEYSKDLPFHLCNLLTFILPLAIYLKKKWLNGVLYFWILVGTFQALLTPDLKEGFPHFVYFRFWTVHAGLVIIVLFALARLDWKVEKQHIIYAVLFANVFLALSLVVNYYSGGNYFYSLKKPDAATLLDYLGDWPWYLLNGQFVMLILFCIYYIPMFIMERRKVNKVN